MHDYEREWERCRLPDDLPFEGWIAHIFDHPILNPQWWWQEPESGHFQSWDGIADSARTLAYITRLFREPRGLICRFTRQQIDQGFNYIVSSGCSDYMFVLTDTALPWPDRRACFDAMITLYTELFAPVYQNDLGHASAPEPSDRPTFACYMWWDVIPLYGSMKHADVDRINDAVLNVFEQVLKLKAESCLESVLHGLGHWHNDFPERTESIIREFLNRTDITPELRVYAHHAAEGAVQ